MSSVWSLDWQFIKSRMKALKISTLHNAQNVIEKRIQSNYINRAGFSLKPDFYRNTIAFSNECSFLFDFINVLLFGERITQSSLLFTMAGCGIKRGCSRMNYLGEKMAPDTTLLFNLYPLAQKAISSLG